MGTMEDQIRKIVREEIARALSAASEVADNAAPTYTKAAERFALQSIRSVMQRVARDVLANQHPEIPGYAVREDEHTTSTPPKAWCTVCSHEKHMGTECGFGTCSCVTFPSTEPVHTITAVPERPKATCTCHRHTHVMGHDDRCGSAFCYCLTPVRAQAEHTASTDADLDYNRACTVCSHGEHDQGKCGMHVYLRGVASPCPCLASRTLGAQPSTPTCTVCEHGPHEAHLCSATIRKADGWTMSCECGVSE